MTPRYVPKCYRWDGKEVPFDYLQSIYRFAIHDGLDHIPADAVEVWYPTHIWETHAKAQFVATAGAPIRIILPGITWLERDGALDIGLKMTPREESHGYQPKNGERGPIGVKVEDSVPSAYIDGIGIAFNAHAPDQLPPEHLGNNYMTIMVRFGVVRLTQAPSPPLAPGDYIAIPRALALEIKRHAAASADLDAELTKHLNRSPA